MRSRLSSALLLATATALLVCGAFVARTAHPLVAEPGAPAVQQQHK
ncbi:MAG: hypothetical protein QOI59_4408 [Gammaproteobacteria bacterium]|nr:hypothetical protein [Gammaproteobacteria bacterium]